jgi:hypothetical protein
VINLTIDGIKASVPEGSTILKAAESIGVKIPTLCNHPDQAVKGNCRVCVCEVEGNRLLSAACVTPVWEGMVVKTRTPKVIEARKTILELILSNHPQDCLNSAGKKVLGYYVAGSRDLLPIRDCLLIPQQLQAISSFFADNAGGLSGEQSASLMLRQSSYDKKTMVLFLNQCQIKLVRLFFKPLLTYGIVD